MTFESMWADLAAVGRSPATGGYRRYAWTATDALLREWFRVADVGGAAGTTPVEESWTPMTAFDAGLRDRLATLLAGPDGNPAPVLPTGAGHDAGILAASGIPSAMLFVRNPTGVSHSPAEHAEPADCLAGVAALARSIEALA